MLPGHTMLGFGPQKEGQAVLKILHAGQNVMQTGIDTRPGQEIKDITIVIGKPPAEAARPAAAKKPAVGRPGGTP